MSHKKHTGRGQSDDLPADFTLLFHPEGSVELQDAVGVMVWSSDSDEEFAEEFDGDFFDDSDSDEIIDYLDECGYVDSTTDEIDIVENDLADEADDNVIEGEFKRTN